jgi:hypothetical protein
MCIRMANMTIIKVFLAGLSREKDVLKTSTSVVKNKSPSKSNNSGKRVAPEFLRPAPGETRDVLERPKSLPAPSLEEREAILTEDIAKNLVGSDFFSVKAKYYFQTLSRNGGKKSISVNKSLVLSYSVSVKIMSQLNIGL